MINMTCNNKSVYNKSLFKHKGYNTDKAVMLSFTRVKTLTRTETMSSLAC